MILLSSLLSPPSVPLLFILLNYFLLLFQNNDLFLSNFSNYAERRKEETDIMYLASTFSGAYSGLHERMLLEDLLAYYNKLERPVANESEAVVLTFGLTLQQIIDVVSLRRHEDTEKRLTILL